MSAWYYLQGKNIFGQPISACRFPLGTVLGGINCNLVNPRYMYSGDPVTGTGWINTQPTDQRQIVSTGPFKLRVGKPVNIILAHIVGRGNSALNSITVSRAYSSAIEQFLRNNFTNIPLSVGNNQSAQIVNDYELYQNYPNPFNPQDKN